MRTTLALLLLIGTGLWFWFDARRQHERACASVRRILRRSDAQLLDDTVSLHGIKLARDRHGRIGLQRSYAFEFTYDRMSRQRGMLTLLSDQVEILDLPGPPDLPR